MTREQFDKWYYDILGFENVFPEDNQRPYELLMDVIRTSGAEQESIQLAPGDQFCINPDGSAGITRRDGNSEQFFPESGWMSIKINV